MTAYPIPLRTAPPAHTDTASTTYAGCFDTWVRASDLTTDPELLPAVVAGVGEMWSAAPAVAAALWWKQYSWYVVDVALDGWRRGRLPDLSPDATYVRFGTRFPYASVAPGSRVQPGTMDFARWLSSHVVDGHLAPLVERLHALTRVGERTLWGSVAHAIALPLHRRLPAPERAVPRLLASIGPPVDGLVDVTARGVVRRTCCLAFRSRDPAISGVCAYCPIGRSRSTAAE